MDTCPACGASVPEGAATCPECQAELREVTASFAPVSGGVDSAITASEAAEGPLLVVRKGPEVGERFYLDRARLVIGRDPASDIFLNDITVSREHAVLEVSPAEVSVTDAGSLNGTYVNTVSVDRAVLRNGDQLQIGRFQMVFLCAEGR